MKSNIIRILLFVIFACSLSFAEEELPKDFIKAFQNYSKAYKNKDAKLMYKYQLPYFRYLNDFSSTFEPYVNALASLDDIKITKILVKNEENIKIVVGLKLKNKKNMVYLQQDWYKIDKDYFILTESMLLFRY